MKTPIDYNESKDPVVHKVLRELTERINNLTSEEISELARGLTVKGLCIEKKEQVDAEEMKIRESFEADFKAMTEKYQFTDVIFAAAFPNGSCFARLSAEKDFISMAIKHFRSSYNRSVQASTSHPRSHASAQKTPKQT